MARRHNTLMGMVLGLDEGGPLSEDFPGSGPEVHTQPASGTPQPSGGSSVPRPQPSPPVVPQSVPVAVEQGPSSPAPSPAPYRPLPTPPAAPSASLSSSLLSKLKLPSLSPFAIGMTLGTLGLVGAAVLYLKGRK
jgi:hypothetical protein